MASGRISRYETTSDALVRWKYALHATLIMPNETTDAYAKAGHLTQVEPVQKVISGLETAMAPLMDNVVVGETQRTVGLRQYVPTNGVDGHFVATDKGQAGRPDAVRFVEEALAGTDPSIGP